MHEYKKLLRFQEKNVVVNFSSELRNILTRYVTFYSLTYFYFM